MHAPVTVHDPHILGISGQGPQQRIGTTPGDNIVRTTQGAQDTLDGTSTFSVVLYQL